MGLTETPGSAGALARPGPRALSRQRRLQLLWSLPTGSPGSQGRTGPMIAPAEEGPHPRPQHFSSAARGAERSFLIRADPVRGRGRQPARLARS
jgi:hypothetical protein